MSDLSDIDIPEGFEAYEVRRVGSTVGHYIVAPGDTLSGIARRHGTTVSEMRNLNHGIADLDLIYPGQLIHVVQREQP